MRMYDEHRHVLNLQRFLQIFHFVVLKVVKTVFRVMTMIAQSCTVLGAAALGM